MRRVGVPSEGNRPWRWAFGVALATHLLAFAIFRGVPGRRAPTPEEPPAVEKSRFEVDLTAFEPPLLEPLEPRASERVDVPPPTPRALRGPSRPAHVFNDPSQVNVEPHGEGGPGDVPAPRARRLTLTELGLEGPNRFLGAAAEALGEPTARELSERVERALMAPLLDRDAQLGLGPAGAVIEALEAAAYAGAASVRGRAVFRAVTDATGVVIEIAVLDVDGDRRGWEGVARETLSALQARVLAVPGRRKKVAMKLELRSAWTLPSGREPGLEINVGGLPLSRGDGKTSTKVEVLGLPKVQVLPPSPDVTSGFKLPDVRIELPMIKLDGDPVDLGARARRMVHGRLLEQTLE